MPMNERWRLTSDAPEAEMPGGSPITETQ
jgi:hypothetical protein